LWSAAANVSAQEPDRAFAQRKQATAAVFFQHLLPELDGLLAQLKALANDPRSHVQALARCAGGPS
jgi:hypothetical protein